MTVEPALTVDDVMAILKCSRTHVINLVHGRVNHALPLPAIRTGRLYRFRKASFERWMEQSEAAENGRNAA